MNMPKQIDYTLAALSNPVRRTMIDQLLVGTSTVKELAAPHSITLGAVSQHLKVLERAGLIQRHVEGRTHHCKLREPGMSALLEWVKPHERFWEDRIDALKAFAERNVEQPE